jgi:hypothetical protein
MSNQFCNLSILYLLYSFNRTLKSKKWKLEEGKLLAGFNYVDVVVGDFALAELSKII